jgi:tetratricopeptide (TPR) repeat protein
MVLSGFSHANSQESVSEWFLTLPSILFFYLKHWLLPVRLSVYYDLTVQSQLTMTGVVLPALVLIAVAVAIWFFRKRLGARDVGYAFAWMAIPLLPALDTFVFAPDQFVQDRYFYVPSIGAALLVALIVERAAKKPAVIFGRPLHVVVAAFALTTALVICAARVLPIWNDDYSLTERGYLVAPGNARAANNFSVELLDRKEIDKAHAVLDAGILRHPQNSGLLYNLSRVLYMKREFPQAEQYVRQSIALAPNYPDAYESLGRILLRQNRTAESLANFRHAVELNPYSAPFHTSYGVVMASGGDCAGAVKQFEEALALNPGDFVTQLQMYRCRAALSRDSSSTK